jgi:hypothetical protein
MVLGRKTRFYGADGGTLVGDNASVAYAMAGLGEAT